jgi:hypothetical protein
MRAVGRLGEMLVPDRVEQVGLAEADAAAPEDRIVFRGIPWKVSIEHPDDAIADLAALDLSPVVIGFLARDLVARRVGSARRDSWHRA